jgi:hypothetical protein
MNAHYNLPKEIWKTFAKSSKYLSADISTILTFELFIAPREEIHNGELSLKEWSENEWKSFNFGNHIHTLREKLIKEDNFSDERLKTDTLDALSCLEINYLSVA